MHWVLLLHMSVQAWVTPYNTYLTFYLSLTIQKSVYKTL